MPTLAQKVAVLFGSQTYASKITNLFGGSIVSYLPLSEPSGSVAYDIGGRGLNGAYSNVTLAQPGIGDGRTAASFDGSTSLIDWYSAGLAAAFSGTLGGAGIWAKVSAAGVWTDATARYLFNLQVDGNNILSVRKHTVNNTLRFTGLGGGVGNVVDAVLSPTAWFHIGLSWNDTANRIDCYVNGVSVGNTASLGTWAGALAATTTAIGSLNTTPGSVWSGLLAHPLLIAGIAPTAAQWAVVANP